MASTASSATAGHAPAGTRRDFLYIATATVGAVGAAATLVPLADQMSGRALQGYKKNVRLVGHNNILNRLQNGNLGWLGLAR